MQNVCFNVQTWPIVLQGKHMTDMRFFQRCYLYVLIRYVDFLQGLVQTPCVLFVNFNMFYSVMQLIVSHCSFGRLS